MCLALYSKKQIVSIFEENKDKYDHGIIIRPDLLMRTKLDVNYFNELNDHNIIIPKEGWCCGCNDRFCIANPDIIIYYGKLFDDLKSYSERKSIISERYLIDKLQEKNINIIGKDIDLHIIRIFDTV
jgi:hypothetical protein